MATQRLSTVFRRRRRPSKGIGRIPAAIYYRGTTWRLGESVCVCVSMSCSMFTRTCKYVFGSVSVWICRVTQVFKQHFVLFLFCFCFCFVFVLFCWKQRSVGVRSVNICCYLLIHPLKRGLLFNQPPIYLLTPCPCPLAHQPTHPFVHPSTPTSIHPYIHPPVRPSTCTSIHPYIRPPIRPSTRTYIHLYIHQSIHTSVHPYVHPPVRPSTCTSIHPCIHPPNLSFMGTLVNW